MIIPPITIDGYDINKIPIETLRYSIGFVPKDSPIMTGAIRVNIDPFFEIDKDEKIKKAMVQCGIY